MAQASDTVHVVWLGQVKAYYSVFFAEPVRISEVDGPSPAFSAKRRRGYGYGLEFALCSYQRTSLLVRTTYELVPLGYTLYAQPADHPNLDLPFVLSDTYQTRRFDRLSIGIGIDQSFQIGERAVINLGGALMRQVGGGFPNFHTGAGLRNDTGSVWVMGLDVNMSTGISRWRGALTVGGSYRIGTRHQVGLIAFYDRPFSAFFTDGKVVLFGLTEYRTTVKFTQSGAVGGLSLSYTYTPPVKSKEERRSRKMQRNSLE